MIVCSNCGRKIVDDSAFCPYCGGEVKNDLSTPASNTEIIEKANSPTKKKISKKTIAVGILVTVIITIIGTILICEIKIDKASNGLVDKGVDLWTSGEEAQKFLSNTKWCYEFANCRHILTSKVDT